MVGSFIMRRSRNALHLTLAFGFLQITCISLDFFSVVLPPTGAYVAMYIVVILAYTAQGQGNRLVTFLPLQGFCGLFWYINC
jgi:hypothetical protein